MVSLPVYQLQRKNPTLEEGKEKPIYSLINFNSLQDILKFWGFHRANLYHPTTHFYRAPLHACQSMPKVWRQAWKQMPEEAYGLPQIQVICPLTRRGENVQDKWEKSTQEISDIQLPRAEVGEQS